MRKLISLVLLLSLLLLSLASCGEKEKITFGGNYYSDYDDEIYFDIVSVDYSGEYPRFNVRWFNNTALTVKYADWYTIECLVDGQWESCSLSTSENGYSLYTLGSNSMGNIQYTTKNFDISKPGSYRLRSFFSVDSTPSLRAWARFAVN